MVGEGGGGGAVDNDLAADGGGGVGEDAEVLQVLLLLLLLIEGLLLLLLERDRGGGCGGGRGRDTHFSGPDVLISSGAAAVAPHDSIHVDAAATVDVAAALDDVVLLLLVARAEALVPASAAGDAALGPGDGAADPLAELLKKEIPNLNTRLFGWWCLSSNLFPRKNLWISRGGACYFPG